MSAKAKKAKAASKEEQRPAHEEPKMPVGRIPAATVTSRHGIGTIVRAGKGFSMGELSGANLPERLAWKWGVKMDSRRRSVLEPNVQSLKKWFTAPHPRQEARPAEPSPEAKPAKKRAPRKKKNTE